MMFEEFKRRHLNRGESMSNALRKQTDMVMNATFERDPAYRKVWVEGKEVDAKLLEHVYQAVAAWDSVDFYLQFRPGVYYEPGTYVDIPNRDGDYERWLIVIRDNRLQFPQHYVLKCDWDFKWVTNGKIYSCLGVQRSRNSYGQGTWRDGSGYELVCYIWKQYSITL